MINYSTFKQSISLSKVAPWHDYFVQAVEKRLEQYTHGELEQWQDLLNQLPEIEASEVDIRTQVSVRSNQSLSSIQAEQFKQQLMLLHPWRKGPFELFDLKIDTEWRSDWKWDRIKSEIADLRNKSILDVGCGNGYHCLRMAGQDARFVLGIDPSQKFLSQFSVMQNYIQQSNCHLLPLGIEDMPADMGNDGFDTVFCMGVLYHRKSPINLIYQLKSLLSTGGELVLETLVVDGDENTVLLPSGRYAQMRNVWFLPSAKALELWLAKCGFKHIKTVDISVTSIEEQRATDWMTFHSLSDYLDPNDKTRTIEGYPAPKRATIIARK
jgi:tRNA (mo5U34)-methyltransferase